MNKKFTQNSNRFNKIESNIFVNSGIRGIAGTGYLQKIELFTLGQAISTLLAEEFDEPCNILIATDTRTSAPWIKEALVDGLSVNEHDIYDAGICPTPFVAKAMKDYQPQDEDADEFEPTDPEEEDGFFALGIVITASHNPSEYNGIKILTEFGYLTPEIEMEISNLYHELMLEDIPNFAEATPPCIDIDLVNFYDSSVMQQLSNIPMDKISVVLDCSNGATSSIAPQIFHSAGVKFIAINNDGDGTLINANSGCSNPQLLVDAIIKHNTDWGCAFDGDGDRVIIAHKSGKVYDGDDLLVFLSMHPEYESIKILIGTFMTNQGIAQFAQDHNKTLIRTQVGERNVINALMHHKAMLGSESCGHITVMDHAFCSDGIFTALLFFDTITSHPEILNVEYTKYPQIHAVVPLNGKTIDTKTIGMIVSKYQNQTTRIVVRPSNTEPIIRIMVEHKDQQQAQEISSQLKELFTEAIK